MADSKLPGIEEEFAELDRELKRLAAMPLRTREQQNALLMALESLRDGWQKKGRAPDAPGWRRVIDEAISTAFDGLLAEMRADAGDPTKAAQAGNVSLDPRLLQRHFRPVFDAIADGLRKNLVQKFRGPQQPGAPTPEVDSADVAAILLTLFGPTKKK
jgi:hypothetical protein